jgi:hypothetical protein
MTQESSRFTLGARCACRVAFHLSSWIHCRRSFTTCSRLQSVTDREFVIIDGQQRIATLSLLAIAVVKRLHDLVDAGTDAQNNEERAGILRRTYLGDKDPTSLLYSSKVFLNLNNDDFYQSYILQLRTPPNPHRLSDSQALLWSAYQYFYGKLAEVVGLIGDGRKLTAFLTELVARRLLFIQITVEDELSAYTVFETLNARGLELTSTDLLKNYLFSLIPSQHDLDHVQQQWNRIANLVGTERFVRVQVDQCDTPQTPRALHPVHVRERAEGRRSARLRRRPGHHRARAAGEPGRAVGAHLPGRSAGVVHPPPGQLRAAGGRAQPGRRHAELRCKAGGVPAKRLPARAFTEFRAVGA